MKSTYLALFLLFLFAIQLRSYSQTSFLHNINASGNDVSSNNGSVTYSIGQVFFSHTENNSGYLREGVQQSFQTISTDNEDVDSPEIEIDALVYPNPTPDLVTLATEGLDLNSERNSYQLYDYQGKLIANQIINKKNTVIDLTQLNTSIYILQVFVEKKLWNTFKIIKK